MSHLKQYLQYIVNTGGVTAEQFDDDWAPIGPQLRADMAKYGLVVRDITDNKMMLTPRGEAQRVAKA